VKSAPATKNIKGPKLHAEGAPRKYRFGMDDSKSKFNIGKPFTLRIAGSMLRERKE
jgi:hypothetical protein